MININKIILVIINIDRGDFVPSLDLFDYHVYITEDLFVGLAIDNPNLRYELNECGGTVYNPDMFANLSLKRITPMLEYIGYNLDVNDILDIMLDEEVDLTRKFYLETVLYYKSNQEGKKINEYKLRVKHFDDLSMDFPEDPKEFRNEFILWAKRVTDAVNRKEGSVFSLAESASFKQYPNANNPQEFNNVYRKTFDLVSLNGGVPIPPGGPLIFPTGITGMTQVAQSYVGVTDTMGNMFSIQYPDLNFNGTNIEFTNPSPNALTKAIAVVDYLKT